MKIRKASGKRTCKQTLSLILALCLMLTIVPFQSMTNASAAEPQDLFYNFKKAYTGDRVKPMYQQSPMT